MAVYMSDLKRQSQDELENWLNEGVVDDTLPALREAPAPIEATGREDGGFDILCALPIVCLLIIVLAALLG